MSRSKHRKVQKQKEQDKQSILLVRGAVVAVALVIVAVLFLQFGKQEQQTILSEDGIPVWHTMELRDVRTGATFTLADFDDKDVVVKITSLF